MQNTFMKILFYSFLIYIYLFPFYVNFSIEDLKKASMFEDEICSYNGETRVSNDTVVECICNKEYTNENNPAKKRIINNNYVQCSYPKKRRFIAFFLAIFIPIGLDHLYLNNYWIFALIFLSCWFTIIGNCFRFAVSNRGDYLKNKYNILFVVLGIFMSIWWIINIILIAQGIFKDGNNIDTVEDLSFLFLNN